MFSAFPSRAELGTQATAVMETAQERERSARAAAGTGAGTSAYLSRSRALIRANRCSSIFVRALIFVFSIAETLSCNSHNLSVDNDLRLILLRVMTAPNRSTVSACPVLWNLVGLARRTCDLGPKICSFSAKGLARPPARRCPINSGSSCERGVPRPDCIECPVMRLARCPVSRHRPIRTTRCRPLAQRRRTFADRSDHFIGVTISKNETRCNDLRTSGWSSVKFEEIVTEAHDGLPRLPERIDAACLARSSRCHLDRTDHRAPASSENFVSIRRQPPTPSRKRTTAAPARGHRHQKILEILYENEGDDLVQNQATVVE